MQDLFGPGDVGNDRDAARSTVPQFSRRGFQCALFDIRQDDIHPLGGEQFAHGQAYATGAAGDDDMLAIPFANLAGDFVCGIFGTR